MQEMTDIPEHNILVLYRFSGEELVDVGAGQRRDGRESLAVV
jgi:hypothetical protein